MKRERVDAHALDRVIERLDREPGLFYACEAGVEGIHERGGWAFAAPPLALLVEGDALEPLAFDGRGAALARLVPERGTSTERLRGLLARLPREQALFGAWQGDYRRAVLYLPDELLRVDPDGSVLRMSFPMPGPEPGWGAAKLPPPSPPEARDDFRAGEYAPRVAEAVARLRRGDVISQVLSQSFRRRWEGSPAAAFQRLRRINANPVMFLARFPDGETLFGASPDMQVRLREGIVESAPVCGTTRRSGDPAEDAARLRALIASAKEESSLAACSDADRVDKAAVSVPGSVELAARRRPMFLGTIIHTVDLTRGRIRPGLDAFDVLMAHRAPATIAGFPKEVALNIIAELEASPRGWYGGAVVRLGADGSLDAGTILRAAAIKGGVAEVRTGGGLMPDSDPLREEEETWLKAEALFAALGLAPPVAPPSEPRARLASTLAVALRAGNDPFAGTLADLLAGIGCSVGEGRLAVVSDPAALAGERRPLLAIGDAALALVGGGERLASAESAARAELDPVPGEFLADLGAASVGFYARAVVHPAALPAGWRVVALANQGRVAAAIHEAPTAIALFFRPDSVISRGRSAGARAVVAALEWLNKIEETR